MEKPNEDDARRWHRNTMKWRHKGRLKDVMNLQTIGSHRPRLSLPFSRPRAAIAERHSPTLSAQELRRLVSEMLG
jgi:hypothetical protein